MFVPQEAIDEELCRGSGFENGKYRIYEYFQSSHTSDETVKFLKKEFGIGGHSPFGNSPYHVDHDGKGLHFAISYGGDKTTIAWTKVAKRISELIAADRYLNPKEKEIYPQWLERQQQIRQQRAEEATVREILSCEPVPGDSTEYIYQYHLGDTVYIGSHEYEVLAFDDSTVRLYDTQFPLMNAEISRVEFDSKVQENPLNNHLRVSAESLPEPTAAAEPALGSENEVEPYTPRPGDRYEIQGRIFIVESVNEEWDKVSLRDITFQNSAGFPIFRSEKLDFIRLFTPILENQKPESELSTPEPQPDEANLTPAWEQKKKPTRIKTFDAFPNVPMSERHNFKIADDNLGVGGAKAKFRANMDAIHLLHDLELDGQLATPEQQEILSRYVGWGRLAQAFDPDNKQWVDEYLELFATLSTQEYESARATTLNAHYTSPVVIKAIYKTLENMGFMTGNILDPGCGIGNFQGLLPDSMSDSKVYGIEIDPITGRIAQQLYQKNSIAIQGYEKTALPDSFFDLAIGNVPFGGYGVSDKKYDKHHFHIHDYFFGATRS